MLLVLIMALITVVQQYLVRRSYLHARVQES